MASLGISEFTFGYAFLFEQTNANWADLKSVPILPSLQEEATGGWDALLPLQGTAYYYQFKLSEYLSRRNAKHIKDGMYNGAYYRVDLHRHNNNAQHQNLRLLSRNNPNTFYVAPELTNRDTFNNLFVRRQLTSSCRLIPVAECDDINDGAQHHFTFQTGNTNWAQHSTAKIRSGSVFGREMPEVYRRSRDRWRDLSEEYYSGLYDELRLNVEREIRPRRTGQTRAARSLLDFDPQNHERGAILARTAELLSVFFGVTLVVVGGR